MLSYVAVALSTVLLLPAALEANLLDIHKGTIVHLLEWKWDDIARECEEFLAPKGYAAVQTSPPHENLVVKGHPYDERHQVVSYKLISRSGNEEQLASMLKRCNKVGVRVFAHAVINHMTADTKDCVGVGGTRCDAIKMDYPGVPYTKEDFHPKLAITDYYDAKQIWEREIFGWHDLDQSKENVRRSLVDYMNHLLAIGFSGFRIDAAVHMDPADLAEIYRRVNNLNSNLGLPKDTRPFIFQEVYDSGGRSSVVSYTKYTPLGPITDFRYQYGLNDVIKEKKPLHQLRNFGLTHLAPDDLSVVFVDGYETERDKFHDILTYKDSQPYKLALAFMLAWGHGYPLILSSYKFKNEEDGPPSDKNDNILSPNPDKNNVCANGWVCQHRWRQVYSMVAFNKATHGTKVSSWWDNGDQQIAFSRGNKGFVAFNMDDTPLDKNLETNLPPGDYCDVISGTVVNGKCEGKTIKVDELGKAKIIIQPYNEFDFQHDGVLAIMDHESSRLALSENHPQPQSSSSSTVLDSFYLLMRKYVPFYSYLFAPSKN